MTRVQTSRLFAHSSVMSAPSASAVPSAPASLWSSTTAIHPPPFFNKFAFRKDGMDYIYLGSTGAVVSRLALGLMSYAKESSGDAKWQQWVLPAQEGEAFIRQALDAGVTFFDTAEIYSEGRSEQFFGDSLQKLLPSSRFTRADLFISTKIFPTRTMNPASAFAGIQKSLSRKAIFDAVEGSLRRLQLDYIDLYFIHRFDPNTSPDETMKALHDLVVAGKIRYLGASSMWTWQFNKLQSVAERRGWTKFTVMQNHYNALYREEEREMIPYCLDSGVALTPYSPLASGLLARHPTAAAGAAVQPADASSATASAAAADSAPSQREQTDKVQRAKYYKDGDSDVIAAVHGVAKDRGVPPAQVALAWLWSKAGVAAPIIGATKAHHISDAVAALQIRLTDDETKRIEEHYRPHEITGHA